MNLSLLRYPLVALALTACGNSQQQPPATDAPSADDLDAPIGSDPDAASSTVDPATTGPFTVARTNASIPGATQGRTLPSTIFAPSGAGASRALVIISPGYQMARTQYTSYASHLASWGFVAILTDYADASFFPDHAGLAADVPAVIDWAIARSELAVDATKIATVGHSLGGKISVLSASLDPRIGAVVGWDPVDSTDPSVAPEVMGSLSAAVAVVGETTNAAGGGMPCAPAAENFQTFFAAAAAPAVAITVANADHMDWVDDRSCGFCGFCTDGTANDEVARTVTRRLDVAWLSRHLLGDASMDQWIVDPPERASNAVTVQQR